MSSDAFKFEYGLSRQIRYYGKRRSFFDGLHRLSLFITAVLGSSAFISIITDQPGLGAVLAAMVAIISSADNVVGFAERAREHSELRTRYYDVYCDFVATDPDALNVRMFRERRLRVDRDAPPPKKILDVIARNEEDIARGYSRESTIHIDWYRRLLRHLIDLPPREWKTVGEVKGVVSPPEAAPQESQALPTTPS